MCKIAFAFIILSVFLSHEIYANEAALQKEVEQEVSTQQAAPANTIESSVASRFVSIDPAKLSGSLSLGYSSNLYEASSYSSQMSSSAEIVLNYRFKESHILRAYMGASQDLSKSRETQLQDGFVAWVNDGFWHRGRVATIGQQVRLAAPLSKVSQKRDEKLTGVTLAPAAVFNLTPMGLTGVILMYQPAVTKNFHQYETNNAFKSNNEYTLSQLFRGIWSFTDRAYLLSDFIYRNAWSYGGAKKDDTTSYSLSAGYGVTNALNVSAGISTDSIIRNFENGSDQSVSFFNQNKSSVFVGLSYVF